MIRFTIILLTAVLCTASLAQETVTPVLAQRLMRVLDRANEEPQQALDTLERMAGARGLRDSDRGFIRREQAALLIREERSDEALVVLEAALQDKDDNYVPPLRLLYAQLLLMEGESSTALPQLELWAQHTLNPHPMELSMLGYAYLQEERWEDSAQVFEQVLATSEVDNDQWYELLAYAYTQNGEIDKAVSLLESVIQQDPAQAKWWRQLANIFLLLEDYNNGAASFAIAEHVEMLDFEDSKRLAGLLSMLDMPADGAAVLESALQRFPEQLDYEDQMLLAELWMLSREHEKSIAAFVAANELADDGEPALKIAQLHLQWERYEDARDALTTAQMAYGEDAPEMIYYLQAIVGINLNELEAASLAIARLDEDGDFGDRAANLDRFIENLRASAKP